MSKQYEMVEMPTMLRAEMKEKQEAAMGNEKGEDPWDELMDFDLAQMMKECYSCAHRRTIPGDAHSRCAKPDPEMKGKPHGIKKGWFLYPWNYDPTWKARLCNNYEKGER